MPTTPASHAGAALPTPVLRVVAAADRQPASRERIEQGRLRRLATRISAAVRSAHSAAVPF